MPFFVQSEFDQHLVDMLLATAPRGQYSARNAVRHMDKAGEIATVDPDMAAFRAITAEEESATAVFHAVRRHNYPGSTALKPHDHLQKNAVDPFCQAVLAVIASLNEIQERHLHLGIEGEGADRRLLIRFRVDAEHMATPIPPLHWTLRRNGEVYDFRYELEQLAVGRGAASILAHLRARKKMRNEILYAGDDGLPSVTLNDFLNTQRRAVKRNLILFLLIDPYAEEQLFVTQGLKGFLRMIKTLPAELEF